MYITYSRSKTGEKSNYVDPQESSEKVKASVVYDRNVLSRTEF